MELLDSAMELLETISDELSMELLDSSTGYSSDDEPSSEHAAIASATKTPVTHFLKFICLFIEEPPIQSFPKIY
jgi:hypothetical protein